MGRDEPRNKVLAATFTTFEFHWARREMDQERDYWAGWKAGWAAASEAIFAARAHDVGRLRAPEPAPHQMAGNKPLEAPRRRGRPPKLQSMAASAPTPRRRGRPPKNRPA